MMGLIRKLFSPYEKPEDKEDVFSIINAAAMEGRKLTEIEWRQMLLATYIRIENHERVCKIRGGAIIVGLLLVILLQLGDQSWPVLEKLKRVLL